MEEKIEFFTNKNNPTINQLVYWFQVNYTNLADEMKNSNHNATSDEPNPYHIEDSVWTHTMLVCQRAEIEDVPKINKIAALLHDLGKPESREVIPFEAKKPVHSESNEIRNNGKNDGKPSGLQRRMPKSGLKTHFRGHEGLSFYKAISVLRGLEIEGVINQKEKEDILTIISMHGTLFDNISETGEMKKPHKVFDKFIDIDLFGAFVTQVRCDSLGRFFVSKDGRKNNAYALGEDIFTQQQFADYTLDNTIEDFKDKKSTISVLIGVPGSGKSTWLNENLEDEVVISRDDTLMEYAEDNNIEGNYSEVWKQLTDTDQKEIDKLLQVKFQNAVKERKSIIVDMTNMSRKSRRKWLNVVPKEYNKEAVVFATKYDEVYLRNAKRFRETGKDIPSFVISNMMKGFMVPTYDEVDNIKWVF